MYSRDIYNLLDIIRLHDVEWDKSYLMIEYFQEKGLLSKEILGPKDIIYHASSKLHEYDLIYDLRFKVPEREAEPMRIKRKGI